MAKQSKSVVKPPVPEVETWIPIVDDLYDMFFGSMFAFDEDDADVTPGVENESRESPVNVNVRNFFRGFIPGSSEEGAGGSTKAKGKGKGVSVVPKPKGEVQSAEGSEDGSEE